MLTREQLRTRIERYRDGLLTLEDLAAWAEEAFREELFEQNHTDQIQETLSILRDTTDPHRFRWEEPDWDEIIDGLGA